MRVNDRVGSGNHVLPSGNQSTLKTLRIAGVWSTTKDFEKIHAQLLLQIGIHRQTSIANLRRVVYSTPINFPNFEWGVMAFTLNTRKVNDVVVVDMSGQLGAGEPVLLLRNTVRRFMEDGSRKFVLNLGQVSYVDSSGLGELITTYTSARNRQGDVKLFNLSKVSKDLLQTTKLLTVFDVFEDESKAVQSLASV